MALTVTEAHAVNQLLAWLLQDHTDPRTPDSETAQAAASLLADRANRTLHAGISGLDVTVMWPALELPAVAPPAEGTTHA